ncbi:MAG: cytochrome c-type biogenesis protein CcmH [Sutterellaceae bacterium]|nr:cytochrome c-type biogenesis protein CcmH [Sutterellaceae bacterium]
MTMRKSFKNWLWVVSFALTAVLTSQASLAQSAPAAQNPQTEQSATKPAGLSGKALYDEAISISKLLRDPASANYTLFDSESAIAGELKARIYEMLREGKTREEIFDFMVARYGEMIRYEPDFNAKTALLWMAPWAVLIAGDVLLVLRMRRRVKK